MSDRLLSRLADSLDLPESEAGPLMEALLTEVHNRAHSNDSGVRIPDLGTFSTDEDGTLRFEPADALKEAANRPYEGLHEEPAAGSASPASTDAPSTTTETKPSDVEEDAAASPSEAPDSGSLWGAAMQSSPPSSASTSSSTDAANADTAEFNAPGSASSSASDKDMDSDLDEEIDDDFWSRDREWDLSTVAFNDIDHDAPIEEQLSDHTESSSAPRPEESRTAPSSFSADQPSRSEPASASASSSAQSPSKSPPPPDEPPGSSSSNRSRLLVGLLAVFLVAAATWVVLGERGTVPGPLDVVERMTAASDPEPTNGETPSPAEDPGTNADPDTDPDAASPDPNGNADPDTDPDADPPPAIDLAAGGWTLVVASRPDEEEARSIRDEFAGALQETNLPVDIFPSPAGDGTMRYRVVVGQFESRTAAQEIRETYEDRLPEDAWSLQLEP